MQSVKVKSFRVKLSKGMHQVEVDCLDGFSWSGGKLIVVNPRTDMQNFLDSVIHETYHRSKPSATEAEVRRVAGDIAKVLYKMGWRIK